MEHIQKLFAEYCRLYDTVDHDEIERRREIHRKIRRLGYNVIMQQGQPTLQKQK